MKQRLSQILFWRFRDGRRLFSNSNSGGANPGSSSGGGGPVSWPTVALVASVGAAAVVYMNVTKQKKKAEAASKVEGFGKPMLGGPWALVDSRGVPTSSDDFKGGYTLIYFGFTFCPDICPTELVKMSRVTTLIEQRNAKAKLTPIFITLDPYRDSCAQVGAYVKDFHPKMVGLTGTPAQIGKAAKKFRVYFAEVDHEEGQDDYLVDHSIVMYLMGPDGEFIDFFTQFATANEVADKIEKIMKSRE